MSSTLPKHPPIPDSFSVSANSIHSTRGLLGQLCSTETVDHTHIGMSVVRREALRHIPGACQHAATEGWHGEIEGLDLTRSFLRSKRAEAIRL
jgi:hypothetical protein